MANRTSMSTVTELAKEAIEQGVFPGCAVGVSIEGVRQYAGIGRHRYAPDSTGVDALSTIYDIASLTKVFTATVCLRLVASGRLHLDMRVDDCLKTPSFGAATIKNLLSHTAGLRLSLSKLKDQGAADIWDAVLTSGPVSDPGEEFYYSNQGYLLLGKVLEAVSKLSLAELFETEVRRPLELHQTSFNPLKSDAIPPTEVDPWRGREVKGEVHDEIAYKLGGVAGHAGLFSSASDLLSLGEMYLGEGVIDQRLFLPPELVLQATKCHFPEAVDDSGVKSCSFGYAWRLQHKSFVGTKASPQTYSFLGFTGPSLMVDPANGVVIAILNNRTYPDRSGPNRGPVHSAITDALIQSCQSASR
jgi:serine-type D-Ala-D-Ala carboxypeptidase